jgi:hypothetical protein
MSSLEQFGQETSLWEVENPKPLFPRENKREETAQKFQYLTKYQRFNDFRIDTIPYTRIS